jgi:DNA-binding IclR family transcriptional regulator
MAEKRREQRSQAPHPGSRGLATARAVLQVQALLARRPEGVRADEVAVAVGKSTSTAYNLLASLCDEGVATHAAGVYRLAPRFRELVRSGTEPARLTTDLADTLDELFARTHKRSYLGLVQGGRMRVVLTRGLQGMPRVPGLGPEIGDNAHAFALGKVALAFGPAQRLQRHLHRGLRAFTPHTITRPDVLLAQLADIRAGGLAVDRRELDDRFWSLAVPLLGARRRLLGGLAVSLSARSAPAEHEDLAATLRELAGATTTLARASRFQACDESHALLDPVPDAALASRAPKSVRLDRSREESVESAEWRPTAIAAPQNRRHGP